MIQKIIIFSTILCLSAPVPPLGGSGQNTRHDPETLEAIPIVVSPNGFPQKNLSLPPGYFVFVLLNRSGLHDITVYLERVSGNTAAPAQQEFGEEMGAGKTRLVKTAKLTPGTYRLRIANRPEWVYTIQVK